MNPGDLVVGDVDGVVIIPLAEVEAVLAAADAKIAAEQQRISEIEKGELVSPWLNDALRQAALTRFIIQFGDRISVN